MGERRKPELLAPAGDMERLRMAVLYGADAVYLAGESFGMRSFAGNFSGQSLPEAVRFALFQRLDYMLHIPISMMNKENEFYMQVWDYLKRHKKEIKQNPYLTKKNKQYLLLLATAPAQARKVHATIKRLD